MWAEFHLPRAHSKSPAGVSHYFVYMPVRWCFMVQVCSIRKSFFKGQDDHHSIAGSQACKFVRTLSWSNDNRKVSQSAPFNIKRSRSVSAHTSWVFWNLKAIRDWILTTRLNFIAFLLWLALLLVTQWTGLVDWVSYATLTRDGGRR